MCSAVGTRTFLLGWFDTLHGKTRLIRMLIEGSRLSKTGWVSCMRSGRVLMTGIFTCFNLPCSAAKVTCYWIIDSGSIRCGKQLRCVIVTGTKESSPGLTSAIFPTSSSHEHAVQKTYVERIWRTRMWGSPVSDHDHRARPRRRKVDERDGATLRVLDLPGLVIIQRQTQHLVLYST